MALKTVEQKKRVGRGEGSGKGKTSGRGHKGFKARQGRDRPLRGFQGGGTGILKAFPKFGFRARKKHSSRLYLDALQYWVQSGRLDASKPITLKDLVVSGCVRRLREEVVLLARGYTHFNIKVDIEVTRATRKSIEVIESQGGSVKAVFIDSLAAQAIMKPEKFAIPPLDPIPVKKDDIARYIDPSRRGYLSSVTTVEDGEQLVEKLLALTKPGSGDKVYRPAKSL
ncbi:ribosomal protein L18e/L15P [Cladochytrium replicatum]|nr:ribosomal protein L18e/L15P [Cladochytrium replicatum]